MIFTCNSGPEEIEMAVIIVLTNRWIAMVGEEYLLHLLGIKKIKNMVVGDQRICLPSMSHFDTVYNSAKSALSSIE